MASNFDPILSALKRAERETKSVRNMKKYNQTAAELIRERVRVSKKGVLQEGGNEFPLKKLATSTIKSRKKKKLHSKTTASTSNLTESGQLLDALYGKGIRSGVGEVAIRKRRKGTRTTNDEVAFFVSGDRPFLDLSRRELKIIEKKSGDTYERALTRILRNL